MTGGSSFCNLVNTDRINCSGIEASVIPSLGSIEAMPLETLVVDPRLIKRVPVFRKGSGVALAIGSFDVINTAALACSRLENCDLHIIPIPLSNDSFCMGRCRLKPWAPSIECKRPSHVYLSIEENIEIGNKLAILGLGEALSSICSIREGLKYKLIPQEKIDFALKYIEHVKTLSKIAIQTEERKVEIFHRAIFSILLSKCQVSKLLGSHEHVARTDHSIGLVLEKELEIPHGLAVALACLIIGPSIMEQDELDFLKKVYKNIAYFYLNSKFEIPPVSQLIQKAKSIRPPQRHPLLLDISTRDILYYAYKKRMK